MIKLDISILDEVGLGELPEDVKKQLYETFVETLELNVGTVLSNQLSDKQLNQFMELIDNKQQEEARTWLEDNAPDYKKVVAEELEKLKAEMKQNAPAIKQSLQNPPAVADDSATQA